MTGLEGGLDLEAPGLEESLGDVLGVLVPAGPLAEAGGADVLVGGELVLFHDLLKGGDGGDDGADGLGLAPVGIAAAFCHGLVSSLFRRLFAATLHFITFGRMGRRALQAGGRSTGLARRMACDAGRIVAVLRHTAFTSSQLVPIQDSERVNRPLHRPEHRSVEIGS